MAKAPPPNLPKINDRVKLRGRTILGILYNINADNWAWVDWDNKDGPTICHLYELEKIP